MFSLSALAPRLNSPDSMMSSPSRLSWKNTLAISAISKSKVMLDSFGTWFSRSAAGTASQDASYRGEQLRWIERLDDPTVGAGALAVHFPFLTRLGREYQHRHELVALQAAKFPDQGNAVHARHVHVGQYQIDGRHARQLERLDAVAGLNYLVARALQGEQHHLTHRCRIVDRQNFFAHCQTVSARQS